MGSSQEKEAEEGNKHNRVGSLVLGALVLSGQTLVVMFISLTPLLCFSQLLAHVHLVKKRLVRRAKSKNPLIRESKQPVCLRQHVFLQR